MPTDDRRASSCARAARAIDRSRVPLEVSLSVVVVFVFVVVMFVVVFVVVFVVFVVVFVVFVDDEERERRDATRRDATRRPTRAFVDGGGSLSSRLSRRDARLRPRVIIIIIIIIGAEIATTSRMDLEGRATGDDVARRLERRARETRERREVSISESRDRGRTTTDDDDGRRRFDS